LPFELGADYLADLLAGVKAALRLHSDGEHFGQLLQNIEGKGVVTLEHSLSCCPAQVRIADSEAPRNVDERLKVVAQIQEGLRAVVNGALVSAHDGVEVLEDSCSRRRDQLQRKLLLEFMELLVLRSQATLAPPPVDGAHDHQGCNGKPAAGYDRGYDRSPDHHHDAAGEGAGCKRGAHFQGRGRLSGDVRQQPRLSVFEGECLLQELAECLSRLANRVDRGGRTFTGGNRLE
jgi:hypothetical protein